MDLTLLLTKRCNWNCSYCGKPAHFNRKEDDLNKLKDTLEEYVPLLIKSFNNIQNINISGGEPGLVPVDIMKFITDLAEKTVPIYDMSRVNIVFYTNGTALEVMNKIPWSSYKNIRPSYVWHPIPEIDNKAIAPLNPFGPYTGFPVIIVTNKNLKHLDKFLINNPELRPEVYTFNPVYNGPDLSLSLDEHKKLVSIMVDNITSVRMMSYFMEKHFIKSMENNTLGSIKKECFMDPKIAIDFQEKLIYHCCGFYETAVNTAKPLNKENIKLLRKGKLFNNDSICNFCFNPTYLYRSEVSVWPT